MITPFYQFEGFQILAGLSSSGHAEAAIIEAKMALTAKQGL